VRRLILSVMVFAVISAATVLAVLAWSVDTYR
jgi:hypothetical protein